MGAFHAYDIRGVYNKDFDKHTVYKVGYFLPQLLGADAVLVGRDCRTSSPEIHDYLLKGITDAGADVYDIGLSSTPMVYFGTANYGFKASVQITASHNPREYNGLKVSREKALPVGLATGLGQIQKWIEEGKPTPPAEKKGQVFQKEIKDDYLAFLRKYEANLEDLDLSFDLSNGMAGLLAHELFGEGEHRHYLYDTIDGTFPNHDPNPLIHDNVIALENSVKEHHSDAGVIFDGDADRVMFVDNEGKFIAPDMMIALLGHYFVDERGEKGIVLQDIRSSKAIGEYLSPMGCQVETWKVGRANAALKLREIDGLWGGELAGHYYFKDFFYSDSGLLASLLVLRVVGFLKKKGVTLAEAIAKIERYENSGEINYRVEDKAGAMDAVRDYFLKTEQSTKMMDFDGYRVEFPQWWFNIRPSNTEPYLRFLAEASSRELLDEKIAKVDEIIKGQFGGIR